MARMLRLEHHSAIASLGIDSHRELAGRFASSSFRRAWLIDGKLAALGGVTGTALSAYGLLWLAVSHWSVHYPLAMVKEARRQLAEIMGVKRVLATTILENDETSKRFAIFLGFVPDAEQELRPASSRYGRRALLDAFEQNEDGRIAVGSGHVVVMSYREAA